MSLDEGPLVGNGAARSLRAVPGAVDAVLLGAFSGSDAASPGPDTATAALEPFEAAILASTASAQVPRCASADWAETTSQLVVAAEAAERSSARTLVVLAADVRVSSVALLDLLDGPSSATAALVLEPAQVLTPEPLATVRVDRTRGVTAAGAGNHEASGATGYSLGVLRVSGVDRLAAARLWRATAAAPRPATSLTAPDDNHEQGHPVDLALQALVRGGLAVRALPFGLYGAARGTVEVTRAAGSPWQQRLRTSSRGNDSPFSKAFVRPFSRRLTAVGLRHGWTPNGVTAASFTVGLAAAALVLVDSWWAWALAAVALLLSLVVDCVDGEIARFTRTYSPLGAWLDGVSDRIKEFAVVATVTVVGVRGGHDLWGLSIALLAVLTVRQVEDQAYNTRLRLGEPAEPAEQTRVAVELEGSASDEGVAAQRSDAGGALSSAARPSRPARPTNRSRAVATVKQVLHVPIAERYLIVSLGLLTHDPVLLLGALTVAVVFALLWTHVGRAVRAVTRRDRFSTSSPDPDLVALVDLGPVASFLTTRLGPSTTAPVSVVVALGLAAAASLAVVAQLPSVLAPLLLVGTGALLGPGCVGADRLRLGWLVPGAVVLAEAAVVAAVATSRPADDGLFAFLWFGAVAWHLFDQTYRLRETGERPAAWVRRLTLGAEGRMLLVAVWWAVGADPALLFEVGAPLLLFCWLAESGYSWRSMARRRQGSRA